MTSIYEEIEKIIFSLEKKYAELVSLDFNTFELKPEVLKLNNEIKDLLEKKKQLEDKIKKDD